MKELGRNHEKNIEMESGFWSGNGMKCPNCEREMLESAKPCVSCDQPLPPHKEISDDTRAQILATLIQSQDSISWIAFSLAMTTESLLLVGFAQKAVVDWGRLLIGAIGLILALVFWSLIVRSNADMGILYKRADKDYYPTFHVQKTERKGIRAGPLMRNVLLGLAGLWVILLILAWLSQMI